MNTDDTLKVSSPDDVSCDSKYGGFRKYEKRARQFNSEKKWRSKNPEKYAACDLPKVQAYRKKRKHGWNMDVDGTFHLADDALAALWEKGQEARAECDLATSAMDNLARLLTQAEAERDLAIDLYGPKGEHDKTLAHIRSILEAHR